MDTGQGILSLGKEAWNMDHGRAGVAGRGLEIVLTGLELSDGRVG